MRFIIHEMAYEQPLTSGIWRYELDDQPTGAIEEWRLSQAMEGYRFLRVDLDARFAPSGRSTVYHLTLDEKGKAAQLKYRFWLGGLEIIGSVLLEEDAVIISRETTEQRQEEVVSLPAGYLFWFPSTAGLGLLASEAGREDVPAITLDTSAAKNELLMGPVITDVTVREQGQALLDVMGERKQCRVLTIRWADQERKVWIGEDGWTQRMERDDGLTAVMSRNIQYRRITRPGVQESEQ